MVTFSLLWDGFPDKITYQFHPFRAKNGGRSFIQAQGYHPVLSDIAPSGLKTRTNLRGF
jgi:hypothetical protein